MSASSSSSSSFSTCGADVRGPAIAPGFWDVLFASRWWSVPELGFCTVSALSIVTSLHGPSLFSLLASAACVCSFSVLAVVIVLEAAAFALTAFVTMSPPPGSIRLPSILSAHQGFFDDALLPGLLRAFKGSGMEMGRRSPYALLALALHLCVQSFATPDGPWLLSLSFCALAAAGSRARDPAELLSWIGWLVCAAGIPITWRALPAGSLALTVYALAAGAVLRLPLLSSVDSALPLGLRCCRLASWLLDEMGGVPVAVEMAAVAGRVSSGKLNDWLLHPPVARKTALALLQRAEPRSPGDRCKCAAAALAAAERDRLMTGLPPADTFPYTGFEVVRGCAETILAGWRRTLTVRAMRQVAECFRTFHAARCRVMALLQARVRERPSDAVFPACWLGRLNHVDQHNAPGSRLAAAVAWMVWVAASEPASWSVMSWLLVASSYVGVLLSLASSGAVDCVVGDASAHAVRLGLATVGVTVEASSVLEHYDRFAVAICVRDAAPLPLELSAIVAAYSGGPGLATHAAAP